MATTTTIQLELHADATVGLNGIIQGNWERLDEIFTAGLSSSDDAYEVFWRAVVRNATDPTTQGAIIEWDQANNRPRWQAGFATVAYATSLSIDCQNGIEQEIDPITGTITFNSLTNQAAGSRVSVILRADGSGPYNLNFPAGWVFVGAAAPANIAASKTAWLELICTGAADSDVVARYSVQP